MSDKQVKVELGDNAGLPDGWHEVPLSSVADVRLSGVDKVARPGEASVRLCNYTDVYNNDYIDSDMEFMHATASPAEIDRFRLRIGDVIITKDSETPDDIGVPAVVDSTAPDIICGYHLALIRPDDSQVDPTFLAKQLTHHRLARYFGQQANGSTRYGLSSTSIAKTPLLLPRCSEVQQAASAVMRLLDAAIKKAEAVIAKLKQMRAGLLHDLLTCGLNDSGDLRDPVAHPEHFRDSALGMIPKLWMDGSLAQFLHATEYGISSPLGEHGTPVLRMNNLAGGEADLTDLKATALPVPEALWLRPLDVLFNRTNSWEHVGRTGIWRGQIERATFASYLVRLTPTPNLLPELLNLWLNAPTVQLAMRRYATPAVNQVNINPTNLRKLLAAFPGDIGEQQQMVELVDVQDEQICATSLELAKLKNLKLGATHDLLTGSVCVPEFLDLEAP